MTSRFGTAFRVIKTQIEGYANAAKATSDFGYFVVVLAALSVVPWIAFFGDIGLYPNRTKFYEIIGFCFFQLVILVSLFAINKFISPEILAKKKMSVLGALLFGVGFVGVAFGMGIDSFALELAGLAVAAFAYALLLSMWFFVISRLSGDAAKVIVGCAQLIALAFIFLDSAMMAPYNLILFLAAELLVFIITPARVLEHPVGSVNLAASFSRADVFVLSHRQNIYRFLSVAEFAFVYVFCSYLFGGRLKVFVTTYNFPVLIFSVCLIVLLILMVWSLAKQEGSLIMNCVCLATVCLIVGLFCVSSEETALVGIALSLSGFFVLGNVFYPVYYNAICHRKGFSDDRSRYVLVMTFRVFPLAAVGGVIGYVLAEVVLGLSFTWAMAICEFALICIVLRLFGEELLRTRHELASKSESSVALKNLSSYASGKGAKYRLTERECEIVQQIMSGRSVKGAANELFLSESTVKTHLRSVYKKLDVHSRQEMIDFLFKELTD